MAFCELKQVSLKLLSLSKIVHVQSENSNLFLSLALSILQNGPMPIFLNEDIQNDLFSGKDSISLCIKNRRTGLDVLGVIKVELIAALTSLKEPFYY